LVRAEARKRLAILGGARMGPVRAIALRRLVHAMNPLFPCGSARLEGRWVARPGDLLGALERLVTQQPGEGGLLLDADMLAFLAAQGQRGLEPESNLGEGPAIGELAMLSRIQERWGGVFPALAARIAADPERLLGGWRGADARTRITAELARLAPAGRFAPMLAVLRDPAARAHDEAGAQQAALRLAAIDAELAALSRAEGQRRTAARTLGHEAAAGLGLAAASAALAAAVLL
jgi:hypothetical protein